MCKLFRIFCQLTSTSSLFRYLHYHFFMNFLSKPNLSFFHLNPSTGIFCDILFRTECLHPIHSIWSFFVLVIMFHLLIVCLCVSMDCVKRSASEIFSIISSTSKLAKNSNETFVCFNYAHHFYPDTKRDWVRSSSYTTKNLWQKLANTAARSKVLFCTNKSRHLLRFFFLKVFWYYLCEFVINICNILLGYCRNFSFLAMMMFYWISVTSQFTHMYKTTFRNIKQNL